MLITQKKMWIKYELSTLFFENVNFHKVINTSPQVYPHFSKFSVDNSLALGTENQAVTFKVFFCVDNSLP